MENEKIILDIVVDVQKDFITGALVNAEAQANVAHLAEVARAHAQAGHWMFFTKDTHPEEYLDTREGRRLPVELRETALGGLAATPFGQSVKARQEERHRGELR